MKFLLITLLFLGNLKAETINPFNFEHINCKVKSPNFFENDFNYLKKIFEEKTSERKLKLSYYSKSKEIFKRDLYFDIKVESLKDESVYAPCEVTLTLKEAATQQGLSKNDRILYRGQTKRTVPRVTFKGKERCTRALKEAFISIPYCISP